MVNYNVAAMRQWIADWRALGVKVLGWGWLEDDPVREAEIATWLGREYALDGYIANAETAYEGFGRGKSRRFTERFRASAPRAPLALSALISPPPWVRDFDYEAWASAGASFRPQCYEGNPLYRLSIESAYDYAFRIRWEGEVQPDILGITAAANVPDDLEQLADESVFGFGVFTAPPTDDDYRAIAEAIRVHELAELP